MHMRPCFLLALSWGWGHNLSAEVLYSVTDLGTLGGVSSVARGINNAGQVVGSSDTSTGTSSHAFLYSNGQMRDLGTLGGSRSYGFAINNAGQVTGVSDTSTGTSHAFLYSNGQMQDLGVGAGYGINDTGQVRGSTGTDTASSGTHAFLYSNGELMDLGTFGRRV